MVTLQSQPPLIRIDATVFVRDNHALSVRDPVLSIGKESIAK
jgi:hypothetical protein